MDAALEAVAGKYRLQWDRSKDWTDSVRLGVNLKRNRHNKFRTNKTRAMFNVLKRLTRLPPAAKRKVAIGPTLTYGCELHTTPEEGKWLADEILRWVGMGYRGSRAQKVSEVVVVERLDELMRRKRVRWAASVYGRNERTPPESAPDPKRGTTAGNRAKMGERRWEEGVHITTGIFSGVHGRQQDRRSGRRGISERHVVRGTGNRDGHRSTRDSNGVGGGLRHSGFGQPGSDQETHKPSLQEPKGAVMDRTEGPYSGSVRMWRAVSPESNEGRAI